MPLYYFTAGSTGTWAITSITAIRGDTLPPALWTLLGATSYSRYDTRDELDHLARVQPPLARPKATCAALIPIRKSAAWWALGLDERRHIFEEQSHHNAIGLDYLPAIARRLHHSRDLAPSTAEPQPFDFLTWFEFAPTTPRPFSDLLAPPPRHPRMDLRRPRTRHPPHPYVLILPTPQSRHI